MRRSPKKMITFLAGVVALSLLSGVWAYYSSAGALDNTLYTKAYGEQLVEKFTPELDWAPGEEITKEVYVENTGDYDLLVRVKMEETWVGIGGVGAPPAGGFTNTVNSADVSFISGNGQLNGADGIAVGDGSVVIKNLSSSANWVLGADGYWYYKNVLPKGNKTDRLLEALKLNPMADMGLYEEVVYYTKAANAPSNDAIHSSDPANHWVVLGQGQQLPSGVTYVRDVSVPVEGKNGYASATYTLTITYEVLAATKEARAEAVKPGYAPAPWLETLTPDC